MRLHFTIVLAFFCFTFLGAQVVVDFEEFDIMAESFLNGSDGSGGFSSGDVFLNNNYNSEFMSWTGWAISNTSDVTTPGFTNQYSAITGSGFGGSGNYAVTFNFDNNMVLTGAAAGQPISGMYITNNTYAYLSMLEGDAFSKKFGGVTGDDPDFFLLTIKAFNGGNISADSVNFYLADFRDADNNQDYIVDEWSWVDLSSLGNVDSLSFTLSSSDVGQFGMNTPAYFCVDHIFADPTNTTRPTLPEFDIFPNPTAEFIQITHSENERLDCTILDANGRMVFNRRLDATSEIIDLKFLPAGSYIISLQDNDRSASKVIIKK